MCRRCSHVPSWCTSLFFAILPAIARHTMTTVWCNITVAGHIHGVAGMPLRRCHLLRVVPKRRKSTIVVRFNCHHYPSHPLSIMLPPSIFEPSTFCSIASNPPSLCRKPPSRLSPGVELQK